MNRLLLDTHIFLWAIIDSPNLSNSAKRLIQTTPDVYVSVLSLFELKAKAAKGKLRLPDNLMELIDEQQFSILDLTPVQLGAYRIFHNANNDPIDNALLAIAESAHCLFLTADQKIVVLQNSTPWIIKA